MELNPILALEVQARWRGRRAFALMLGYAAALALAMGFIYLDATGHLATAELKAEQLATVGHRLFTTLTWLQTLGWLVLAPALTAGAIAGERERGLLEALQLSQLSARQIVLGKMASALLLIGLLLLVPLPIIALCFQLGGVSPGEFIMAALLHAATALTGAALGLDCSAHCRRTNQALKATAACALAVNVGFFGIAAHPILAALGIFAGANDALISGIAVYSIIVQTFLTIFFIGNAIQALRRPLPDFAASAGVDYVQWLPPTTPSPYAGALPDVLVIPARAGALAMPQAARTMWPDESLVALWHRPAQRLEFANPVLRRAVAQRLRAGQQWLNSVFENLLGGSAAFVGMIAAIPVVAAVYLPSLTWWGGVFLWLPVLLLGGAIMGALGFSREREAGMLQQLLLTPLARREIIAGKLGAPLFVCGYYSAPLLPILLLCTVPVLRQPDGHIRPAVALASLLIVAASTAGATLLGLLFSWRCKTSPAALSWTLAALFIWLGLLPLLPLGGALPRLHPFLALSALTLSHSGPLLAAPLTLLALDAALLVLLSHAMRHGPREPEKRQGRR